MAQAPQGFTYQGVATENNGFELQNQTISIQASILSSSATGTTVWQETHTTTTDTFGLFNVTIGEGISTNGGSSATFQEIDWGAASHFMKVEIDVNGGSNYVHVGTSQMMSVPYALYAENVHNLNMDSILGAVYDSISNNNLNDSMLTPNLYLQCVDMGISPMCGSLGLDPSNTLLSSNNYDYLISFNTQMNGNYISKPHWRKFKIEGLQLNPTDQLMFQYNYTYSQNTNLIESELMDPLIINGEVYFYMYSECSSTNTAMCDDCANAANIGIVIPLSNAIMVRSEWGGNSSTSMSKNRFEIFYETVGSFKTTGIVFNIINY